MLVERIFHGTPSGLDVAAVLSDKPILFKAGQVVSTFENKGFDFVLVDSGPREQCAGILSRILDERRSNPEKWMEYSDRVEQLTNAGSRALERSDASVLSQCMSENQNILTNLGLNPSD